MAGESPALPSTEQLFEEMPCGLLVTAVDGTILRVNRTFCNWVGSPPDALVGKKRLQELFTMGARIFHQTHWLPMLEMQGSISEVKFDVRTAGGKTLPMMLNVQRRSTESGICDEIAAFIAEDRNRYERELLAARKRADELTLVEQDKTLFAEQMIGIVSHDLRTPLSVIMLAGNLLTTSAPALAADKARRMAASIVRAGDRAHRLINDLLDFTVARVGRKLSVSMQPVDLHQVAVRALEESIVAYPGRTLRHVGEGNGQVVADPDRLAQLLGNLIGNAMVYGDPEGTVTITSVVERGSASLRVHNTGVPIPPELLTTMFEPMVRGETTSVSGRSVGLGLYIVKAIAAAHMGSVSVASSLSEGTEFSVTFPSG